MFYDRKIKYLDYYEGGSKVSGGGFAKLEVRDNTLRLELTVRGLHPTDSFERDIVLQGAGKEETLGQIRIQNGSGQFRYTCDADQGIGATGIPYSELCGIRISIGGTREILCQCDNGINKRRITSLEETPKESKSRIQESNREPISESYTDNKKTSEAPMYIENMQFLEPKIEKTKKAEEKKEKEEEKRVKEGEKKKEAGKEECESIEDKGRDRESKDREYKNKEDKDRESKDKENSNDSLQTVIQSEEKSRDLDKYKPVMTENNSTEQPDMREMPVKLMEDKWQQLSAIYPHIQPFRDERDYLSLTPSDFVLFPNRFYRAVNNSFLLHGYYNYHHLILARIERRGEILYYIGVPGNYFERERQVAIMFGFESFECETEPAKTGDFGYYMMRTEL